MAAAVSFLCLSISNETSNLACCSLRLASSSVYDRRAFAASALALALAAADPADDELDLTEHHTRERVLNDALCGFSCAAVLPCELFSVACDSQARADPLDCRECSVDRSLAACDDVMLVSFQLALLYLACLIAVVSLFRPRHV